MHEIFKSRHLNPLFFIFLKALRNGVIGSDFRNDLYIFFYRYEETFIVYYKYL